MGKLDDAIKAEYHQEMDNAQSSFEKRAIAEKYLSRLLGDGYSHLKIASILGMHVMHVKHFSTYGSMMMIGFRTSPAMRKRIKQLHQDNVSMSEIAKIVGVAYPTVSSVVGMKRRVTSNILVETVSNYHKELNKFYKHGGLDYEMRVELLKSHIDRLVKDGYSISTIANAFKVSESNIKGYLETGVLGVRKQVLNADIEEIARLRSHRKSIQDISKQLKLSGTSVGRHVKELGTPIILQGNVNEIIRPDVEKEYRSELKKWYKHGGLDYDRRVALMKSTIDKLAKAGYAANSIKKVVALSTKTIEDYLETGELKLRKQVLEADIEEMRRLKLQGMSGVAIAKKLQLSQAVTSHYLKNL